MRREQKALDVSASPDLLKLAEEVSRSGMPRKLRRNGETLAIIAPFSDKRLRRLKKRDLTAQDIADFESAAGSWADVDTDQLLADIYAHREMSYRPPLEL